MCIGVFIWQSHPKYPLVLLLNRDEYHHRPTKPISWWEGCGILGGRDEVAGGTWLGCTREGRLAFLTNVMEPPPLPELESRGDLPVRFLKCRKSPMEFVNDLAIEADQYNGFNLVVADLCSKTMAYISNRPKGDPVRVREVSPGIHVVSNANDLDAPWHKAQRLHNNFKELLDKYSKCDFPSKVMVEELMLDTVKADESRLPRIRSFEWEYNSSSIFIDFDNQRGHFGTRSTTALTVKASGQVSVYEKHLGNEGWEEHTVDYQITKVD
ncbi:hypothetical protein Sjap_009713 [Stephania japonica]|uniref:Uncharacterized protein n=1 Tax=Stephania japonica TaxID=461633 RepID=A0AAP0JAA8_9MAGN